jgi:Putative adhesin
MQALRSFAVFALILFAGPAFGREAGTFDRTLSVAGTADLDVQTGSGHITVRSGAGNSVHIRGIINISDFADSATEQRAREIQANPPIQQTGNAIRIEKLDDAAGRGISISYEIETPPASKLRARTGSGRQTIEGIQGPVEANTGSGGIRITDVGDEVRASTGSGSIELDRIRGRVEASTGSGRIHASETAGQVTAHTGSGGVNIQLPATGGFDLHARTGSGGVTVNPPITMENFSGSRHDVRGKIRGGGPLLELSTGSGGVRVE